MYLKNIEIDEKENEVVLKRGLTTIYIRNQAQSQLIIDFEKEGSITGVITTEMDNICHKCTSFEMFKEFVKEHPEEIWRMLHSVFVSTLTL